MMSIIDWLTLAPVPCIRVSHALRRQSSYFTADKHPPSTSCPTTSFLGMEGTILLSTDKKNFIISIPKECPLQHLVSSLFPFPSIISPHTPNLCNRLLPTSRLTPPSLLSSSPPSSKLSFSPFMPSEVILSLSYVHF